MFYNFLALCKVECETSSYVRFQLCFETIIASSGQFIFYSDIPLEILEEVAPFDNRCLVFTFASNKLVVKTIQPGRLKTSLVKFHVK